ncbi:MULTISPECIES: methyltransferase [unclassified Pseudodesulfovibrio]|uniref:methyltransferase n=1 Tax=unclassified Pseudodesulfovibrio TaxID=2661612 RepID=UPI0013E2AF94|nr:MULTISPECIES: methyltransferase [unclassified Pseudodesulfovibrio]MCJ2163346.1 acetylserotonin O-methyltransferase [Pseudodesulfovibrio sp. S3-i]
MMISSLSTKAVMSAVELKVFDRLEGQAKGAEALAAEMGLVAERLEPILDILVAADLLARTVDGYVNTAMASEYLVSSAPLYQGDSMALTMRFNAMVEDSITALVSGGEVGRNVTDNDWGVAETMEGTAQDAKGNGLSPVVDLVAGLPGFDEFRTMGDIGGNHGSYTMGVLERNDEMHGTIFDLPHVVEQAQARCDRLGFGDRVTTHGLDFREDRIPAGHFDLILTSHVLYAFKSDLGDALARIAEGLKPGGWFVSHHCFRGGNRLNEMAEASLELLTRLCGYSSHFIEQDELVGILGSLGFDDIRCRPVSETGLGLMVAARKK